MCFIPLCSSLSVSDSHAILSGVLARAVPQRIGRGFVSTRFDIVTGTAAVIILSGIPHLSAHITASVPVIKLASTAYGEWRT